MGTVILGVRFAALCDERQGVDGWLIGRVVRLQRHVKKGVKFFAGVRGVWWNTPNFPQGGWPGHPDAVILRSQLLPSSRCPLFNLGDTRNEKIPDRFGRFGSFRCRYGLIVCYRVRCN